MLTSQGQSAVLCSSTMLPLSEYILEIYVLCNRVKEGQSGVRELSGGTSIIRPGPQLKEYLSASHRE